MKKRKYHHNIKYLTVKPCRTLESLQKVTREPGRRPRRWRNSEGGRTCAKTLGVGSGMGEVAWGRGSWEKKWAGKGGGSPIQTLDGGTFNEPQSGRWLNSLSMKHTGLRSRNCSIAK